MPEDTRIKLRIDGKDVGEALTRDYKDGEVFLTDFEIFDEYRNKGYGQKALTYLIDKCGVNSLTVDPNNKPAMHIYGKFGFKQIGEPYYDENAGCVVIYMKKGVA
jgi:ribosomal protein S18 acetylase RimI-like enzyme